MKIIYHIILGFWAIAILPRTLFQYFFQRKYHSNLAVRLGLRFPQFPIKEEGEMRIWIHAVSLGETKAVAPFIERIKKDFPAAKIFFSSTTETGQKEAREKIKAIDHLFFLPLDFGFLMKRIVRSISPDLFILVETDFWYNMLKELKKEGAKIALINGKISKSSFQRYKSAGAFSKRLFGFFDLMCLQSDEYKKRFVSLGVSERKISVTGNIKFDVETVLTPSVKLNLPTAKQVVAIVSTHENEEEMILSALKEVSSNVCLLLAPRHPERFEKVKKVLKKNKISFRTVDEESKGDERVILVDKIGVLDQCYEISKVAIMGGSFVKNIGGHNIYEPIRSGIPVIYGPYMYKQEELVRALKKHNIGKQVALEDLQETLIKYLEKENEDETFSTIKGEMEGATDRSWELVKSSLGN